MIVIYTSKLNKELKQNIMNHAYSLQEMNENQNRIKDIVNTRQKGFRRVLISMIAVTVLILILTLIETGFHSGMFFGDIGILIFVIMIPVFLWFLYVGNLKNQYNKAVKQGYPEYADKLHL